MRHFLCWLACVALLLPWVGNTRGVRGAAFARCKARSARRLDTELSPIPANLPTKSDPVAQIGAESPLEDEGGGTKRELLTSLNLTEDCAARSRYAFCDTAVASFQRVIFGAPVSPLRC